MDIKWILIAISVAIVIFEGNAKKAKSDGLTVMSEESQSSELKSGEELSSDRETKNHEVHNPNACSKGRKTKKHDPETLEKYPSKNKKTKKHNKESSRKDSKNLRGKKCHGKSSEENPKKKHEDLPRNKREARIWDGVEVPRSTMTKIKKKELMDQENTGVDGEAMQPFESELAFEKFERDQPLESELAFEKLERDQMASSPSDETVPVEKSKTIKKYTHLDEMKNGKIKKERKYEKHAKADKLSKKEKFSEEEASVETANENFLV